MCILRFASVASIFFCICDSKAQLQQQPFEKEISHTGTNVAEHNENSCGIYMTISKLSGHNGSQWSTGRGIFAGRDYQQGEFIDHSLSLLIPFEDTTHSQQLSDYTFSSGHPMYSIIEIGVNSFLNSDLQRKSVQHFSSPGDYYKTVEEGLQESTPYLNYTDTALFTIRDIKQDEELLTFYGEEWYALRNLSVPLSAPIDNSPSLHNGTDNDTENAKSKTRESIYHKICLSDVFVKGSYIWDAGRGLFVNRRFQKGEIVTVSPVAALERSLVDSTSHRSLLKNYCLASSRSAIVLFLLGKAAMMNHQAEEDANVEMRWFSWRPDEDSEVVHAQVHGPQGKTVRELVNSPTAPFDIAFYAKRDIMADEELYLDYGEDWEELWRSAACHQYDESGCEWIGEFRSYIGVPDGLFPATWSTNTIE